MSSYFLKAKEALHKQDSDRVGVCLDTQHCSAAGYNLAEKDLIDGGINELTAPLAVKSGADILVAGTAVFNKKETVETAMGRLRDSIDGLQRTP